MYVFWQEPSPRSGCSVTPISFSLLYSNVFFALHDSMSFCKCQVRGLSLFLLRFFLECLLCFVFCNVFVCCVIRYLSCFASINVSLHCVSVTRISRSLLCSNVSFELIDFMSFGKSQAWLLPRTSSVSVAFFLSMHFLLCVLQYLFALCDAKSLLLCVYQCIFALRISTSLCFAHTEDAHMHTHRSVQLKGRLHKAISRSQHTTHSCCHRCLALPVHSFSCSDGILCVVATSVVFQPRRCIICIYSRLWGI